jgi:uncharacterized protein (TIGR04141 family)
MAEPKRHLSMFLMKAGTGVEDALRDPSQLARHELQPGLGVDGVLFLKTTAGDVPWWVEFLNPLASDDLRAPVSRTTSAVLSIRLGTRGRNARTVCFTFGHGRYLLDERRIDHTFGLRVALNTVDPRRLRGFDVRRQEDIVVSARIQTSRGADLGAFDLDTLRDMLRSAAGGTRDEFATLLGSLIRGSVGVTFDVPIQVDGLVDRHARFFGCPEETATRRSSRSLITYSPSTKRSLTSSTPLWPRRWRLLPAGWKVVFASSIWLRPWSLTSKPPRGSSIRASGEQTRQFTQN